MLNALFSTNGVHLATFRNGSNCGFSWNAIPGRTYHLQWKHQLSDANWTALTDLTASSNTVSFSEAPSQTQRFYRVAQ